MKLIILAAGVGSRLRPLTNTVPKCMVEYREEKLIDKILQTARRLSITDISVVVGYKGNVLQDYLSSSEVKIYYNKNYKNTNMIRTLFCAEEELLKNDDVIISYSDIIYSADVLQKLIASSDDVNVVIDRGWKNLWQLRMPNPLFDAETLKIENGYISEIGKTASTLDEIEGQFIGLVKIKSSILPRIVKFFNELDVNKLYEGKTVDDMYTTTFLQLLIDHGFMLSPVDIDGQWLEIDSINDLNAYIKAGLRI